MHAMFWPPFLNGFATKVVLNESNAINYGESENRHRALSVEIVRISRPSQMRCLLKVFPSDVSAFIFLLLATSPLVAQAVSSALPPAAASFPSPQSPFSGSAPEGKATTEVLQIDFKDAIDRGLRTNLGLLLADDQTEQARGERWRELSDLLPNV